ncbi:MAG: hypothetical protein HYX21_01800 [Candidatus Yanofskybacteria bacterium]|nr:hypothetical protein [Candidatus Yanofskybacteria bacterium]
MSILQEIRKQPEHIRHTLMWLCVVTSFSLVVMVWFKSTQSKFVAMLHPTEILEEVDANKFADRDLIKLAEQTKKTKEEGVSVFAAVKDTFSLLRASISELMGSSQTGLEKTTEMKSKNSSISQPAYKGLPLSGDR